MKHITSRQNPLVSSYRAVADGSDRTQLLIDGVHLLTEALDAGISVTHAVVTLAAVDRPEIAVLLARLRTLQAEVNSASPAVMAAVSPVRSASPIVALAPRPATSASVYRAQPALVVGAIGVQDPGNVGAIIRVAEAGGATAVAIAGQSADPYGWKALRGAMGSAFRLPLAYPCSAEAILEDSRARGCRVVATIPRGGAAPDAIDLRGPIVLLVGGEGAGLPPALVTAADEHVSIPMAAAVESLNTAMCAALLVYEARRQRSASQHLDRPRLAAAATARRAGA